MAGAALWLCLRSGMEEAHFYADDIQPPLIFFVSVRRTSADNTEFKKNQNEKGVKKHASVFLHMMNTC